MIEPNYRPDIDGMRAIAVLLVVAYHLTDGALPGGYVGVDVFFVISGFLITRIIVTEMDGAGFSIAGFYERRIRRIFPALFLVLIVCALAAPAILLPTELKDFGQSLAATVAFVSNFLFWSEDGYFDPGSHTKPLLHMWSLAVEEQFYLTFPVLLLLLRRFSQRVRVAALCVLWVVSFWHSHYLTTQDPEAAFFLAPSRAWELLTGALLVFVPARFWWPAIFRQSLSGLGLVLILYAALTFDDETRFPGMAALVPCLGSAMLILAGSGGATWGGRLLAARPLVFVGLISYSLYLWHWPLYVYATLYFDGTLSRSTTLLLFAGAFLLSWLSWRFVERPFRSKRSGLQRRRIGLLAGAVALPLVVAGVVFHLQEGVPQRLPAKVQSMLAEVEHYHRYLPEGCLAEIPQPAATHPEVMCRPVAAVQQEAVSQLVWGDSHAAAMVPALAERSTPGAASVAFAGKQLCPPALGVQSAESPYAPDYGCAAYNQSVLAAVRTSASINTVLLSAYWPLYVEGQRAVGNPNRSRLYLYTVDEPIPAQPSTAQNAEILRRGLKVTISELLRAGKRVVLIGPVPEIDINGIPSLARRAMIRNTEDVRASAETVRARIARSVALLTGLAQEFRVPVMLPHDSLCDVDYCRVERAGVPYYIDRNHLSVRGASSLSTVLDQALRLSGDFSP